MNHKVLELNIRKLVENLEEQCRLIFCCRMDYIFEQTLPKLNIIWSTNLSNADALAHVWEDIQVISSAFKPPTKYTQARTKALSAIVRLELRLAITV